MHSIIGIRKEDKSRWERRVPLIPKDIEELVRNQGMEFVVQPSQTRIFPDAAYAEAGASLKEDLSICPIVMAVKEIPISLLQKERTYVFFSHTIKGQCHNMDMLRRLMELQCNVIDYEKITDAEGRRLIFFGRHAGLAGMIDTLWALGRRVEAQEGIETPFLDIQPAHTYTSLSMAKAAVAQVGQRLAKDGIDDALQPLICGFAGYGNVSRGAQEIFNLLPTEEISPALLGSSSTEGGDWKSALPGDPRYTAYKVVFEEKHLVRPKANQTPFVLQDYYDHPEHYTGVFESYLDKLTVLMNCIYWEERYPRLLSKAWVKKTYTNDKKVRLRIVGDVSCDVEGAIEATVRTTQPDAPVFVYDGQTDKAQLGFSGRGLAVLAVDNLPCELSREASEAFSAALKPFIKPLADANMRGALADTGLPPELHRALILHHGRLTPPFEYMKSFL